MPGVNGLNRAGVPSVSDSVAGTVPPTVPCVHSDRLASWPRAIFTVVVSSTVPSAAVQVRIHDSSTNAELYWLGRADGFTCHSNRPFAGTVIVVRIAFGNARICVGWPVPHVVSDVSSV